MTNGKQVTLFAMDCGATNWRLYRVGYQLDGSQIRILGDPQPAPLTSFSEHKLPAVITLNPEGTQIENIGEVSQSQLEDEASRDRVREYFKPCLGAHLVENPLPHQKRYTHAQALNYTQMLLKTVVEQIRTEKWRSSAFDEHIRFAFAFPVHWQYDHKGKILEDFKGAVLKSFSEHIQPQIDFIPEPEGAILSLKQRGLLGKPGAGELTLIVDVGGSTTDIVVGQIDPRNGELLYLGHYGEPFGGGVYDSEMANYLVDILNIPTSEIAKDPSALVTLRVYGQRLKESLSRQLLYTGLEHSDRTAQRMITLVLTDGQIFRRLVKLDENVFHQIVGHIDMAFHKLIDKALQRIGITEADIGQVALVGGGVQLFSIVRYLRERFGDKKIILVDNPDEIVVRGIGLAYGASIATFEPGASLVIDPPALVASDQEVDTVPKPVWQLISSDGKAYLLHDDVTKVGRARKSHIWLESEKVSRQHAELRLAGDTLAVIDFGSTNGTFVNEERIQANQPTQLQPGDEIRFGDKSFTLKH